MLLLFDAAPSSREHIVDGESGRRGVGEDTRDEGAQPRVRSLGGLACAGPAALMNEPTPRRVSSTPARSRSA